jgi:hypothetical protein
MSKLTLSVNASVVSRAKRYAKRRGVSVSSLVEGYLDTISQSPENEAVPPILGRLRGCLKGTDPLEYKRHLSRKYR